MVKAYMISVLFHGLLVTVWSGITGVAGSSPEESRAYEDRRTHRKEDNSANGRWEEEEGRGKYKWGRLEQRGLFDCVEKEEKKKKGEVLGVNQREINIKARSMSNNRGYKGNYGSLRSRMTASGSKQSGYVSSHSAQVKLLYRQSHVWL